MRTMTLLSVNVNKIATLRNSRGSNQPDLRKVTRDIIQFGAQSITVHPRPDERHIKKRDVYALKEIIFSFNKTHPFSLEYNIEGFPSRSFLDLICKIRPTQCTLVPDAPGVLTSEEGWNMAKSEDFLAAIIEELRSLKVRSSLFVNPFDFVKKKDEKESLLRLNPSRVEIYTGVYAKAFSTSKKAKALEIYKNFSNFLEENSSIELNAGHDLNLENLSELLREVPFIREVSIGHALICEALYEGLEKTVKKYLEVCSGENSSN